MSAFFQLRPSHCQFDHRHIAAACLVLFPMTQPNGGLFARPRQFRSLESASPRCDSPKRQLRAPGNHRRSKSLRRLPGATGLLIFTRKQTIEGLLLGIVNPMEILVQKSRSQQNNRARPAVPHRIAHPKRFLPAAWQLVHRPCERGDQSMPPTRRVDAPPSVFSPKPYQIHKFDE
jgi:hypothetical protein